MKTLQNLISRTVLVVGFMFLLVCFVPDAKAQQIKFDGSVNAGIVFAKADYHIIVKNIGEDSTYTDKNIFVNIDDVEKNIVELSPAELRQAIAFVLKCWNEQSKREYERQQELYKRLVQVNSKKKGKK